MNFEQMKMSLSEIGPARLTKDYDYENACDDMEQINLLLRKRVFKTIEQDGLKIYRADVTYNYNKYYRHLTSNPKLLTKTSNEFAKKVKRYSGYLYEYYSSVYGEPFNADGSPTTWYKLFR